MDSDSRAHSPNALLPQHARQQERKITHLLSALRLPRPFTWALVHKETVLNKYEGLYVNIIGTLIRYIHFLPLPCVATTSPSSPSSPSSPPSLAAAAASFSPALRRSAADDVFELVVQDPAAAVHYEYNNIHTMNEGAGTFPSCATQTSRRICQTYRLPYRCRCFR